VYSALEPPLPEPDLISIGNTLGKQFYCVKSAKAPAMYGVDVDYEYVTRALHAFEESVLRKLPTAGTMSILLRVGQVYVPLGVRLRSQHNHINRHRRR
jgi:hypothetical protein